MEIQAPKVMEEPRDENPISKLWWQLVTNNMMLDWHLFEFMKFVQFAIVQVIGSVEDERTFSTLPSMKSKLWNWLIEHLNIAICKFVQGFFFAKAIFALKIAIATWNDSTKVKIGMNA